MSAEYNPSVYVLMTPMWEVFTDKDALTFLGGGYALFWCDNDRSVYKEVYQLTDTGGAYPNYTYQPYGFLNGSGQWQVNLNSQGAFDQVVYGYIQDTAGNPQQYFVQFYNANGVFQFSREAWPNIDVTASGTTTLVETNLISNPQFITHNNLPAPSGGVPGQVTSTLTIPAYGRWSFERSNNSPTDIITFYRFGSYTTPPPSGNPRYGITLECNNAGSGTTFKYLAVKYTDVNKFASPNISTTPTSPTDPYTYTFAFQAINNGAGTVPVQFILIRNFGTGGSPSATIINTVTTFNITTSYTSTFYNIQFDFPSNIGQSIGTNDDDFVQIALQMPLNGTYNVTFTNFILTQGYITNPAFLQENDSVYLYRSLFASNGGTYPDTLPDYTGLDLGLPVILGPIGFTYDTSVVGSIEISMLASAGYGRLVCDGQTSYDTTLSSSDGIPYSRLFNAIFNNTLDIPLFGTGPQFVTMSALDSGTTMILSTNSVGTVTATADGGVATGFGFHSCHTSTGTALAGTSHYANTNQIYWIGNNAGFAVATATGVTDEIRGMSADTSGFTAADYFNTPYVQAFLGLKTIASSSMTGGTYFTFYVIPNSGPPAAKFYCWFKLDGTGSDPAAGGTGLEIDLYNSTFAMTSHDVAKAITRGMNNYQTSFITFTAGSAVTASSYFTFSSTTTNYYAWYTVDGAGTDPAIVGKIGIKVAILSTDTATQVASKTKIAINSRYFATPDIRGYAMRFWANGNTNIDLDQALRWSSNSVVVGDVLGTYEWYQVQAHNHQVGQFNSALVAGDPPPPPFDLIAGSETPAANDFNSGFTTNPADPLWGFSGYSGGNSFNGLPGSETRMANIYVNGFIRY